MKRFSVIVAVVVATAIAFFGGRKYESHFKGCRTDLKTDTLVVVHTDTINQFYPVEIARYVYDTIRVAVAPDTIRVRDTIYMSLPVERVTYQDTTYKAVVSGYHPRLDTIEVYQRERIVTITERAPVKRWGVGAMVGYGVCKSGLSPYVGIGVTYDIVRW